MRSVLLSDVVEGKIADLRVYLVEELQLSHAATHKRIDRINIFLKSLSAPVDYSLCRFKQWQELGYRCAPFEKGWIFAYEVFDDGIIVRDMRHAKSLAE